MSNPPPFAPLPFLLLLSYLLLLKTPASAQPIFRRDLRRCGHNCNFRMCQLNATTNQFFVKPVAPFLLFGKPQFPDSPTICLPGFEQMMDIVEQVGEAQVFDRDLNTYIPISQWQPVGLSHPFPPSVIDAFNVQSFTKSGVTVSSQLVGNQWSFLHDQCMILPIHRYRVGSDMGLQRVSTGSEPAACAAFKITAPELRFQLFWDTGDDLDLVVEEPDGQVIDFNQRFSETGKLNSDENRGLCSSFLRGGRENIVYFPNNGRQVGQYVVEGFLNTKCTSERTTWTLRVLAGDQEVMGLSGVFEDIPTAGEQVHLFKREVYIS